MECISKEMLERISLVENSDVSWMPECNDGYYYRDSDYEHFKRKLFFLAVLKLYKELGLVADFNLQSVNCFDSGRDHLGNYLPDVLFEDDFDDNFFSIRYEFQLSFREWNECFILPILDKIGWTVLIGDACMDILNSIEGVNIDEDYSPGCMDEWSPVVAYSEKWRNYFNELHKYPDLENSSECAKLFKASELDFFSVFFTEDDAQNARNGVMFHNIGISGDGSELFLEAISPEFPLLVLKAEYYMWELAKNHPETGLLQIMESGECADSDLMQVAKSA